MARSRTLKALIAGLASAFAITATTLGVAHAEDAPPTTASADMPSAVEDFSYPDAEKIKNDTGAILKRGDGHILLTECDGNEDIDVFTRSQTSGRLCFDVTAKPAYLELEVPIFFGIVPAQDPVKVTVESATGATQSTTAPPNTVTSFGESANPPTSDVTLVELRVSS